MLVAFGSLITQLLHVALILVAAPILVGAVRWLKARLMGRRGPHLLQPWRDILKLLRKRPILAETASAISRVTPYLALGATALAAALIPSFAQGMLLAPMADLVLIGGLLALARVALALNGHDAGTPFGGMGAAREMTFAVFAEPALLVCVMTFAVLAGGSNVDAIGAALREGQMGLRVSLLFAGLALTAVMLAENARIPVDNPATHLELTMVHEAMLLEASGRHLAIWEMQSALKLTLWFALLAAIFLPAGTAPAGSGPLAWAIGLAFWVLKMGLLALALAFFESAIAKMRVFRVPDFLGGALLLALLAAALIFVSTGWHDEPPIQLSAAFAAPTIGGVMGFGDLPYDMAHVLGGAMLLVSFVLLYQRRTTALVNALALQGCLLAAAAVWQGYVQGASQLYITGFIALAAKGIAIPLYLHRMMQSRLPDRTAEPTSGMAGMLGGVLLVALAILVVLPVTTGAKALAREDLAVALSIVLLGLLTMLTRRSALGQVAGLMTLENGLILAAVGVAGMPLVIEISTAGLVLIIAVIAGFFTRLLRERFDSLDTDMLHPHRGEGP